MWCNIQCISNMESWFIGRWLYGSFSNVERALSDWLMETFDCSATLVGKYCILNCFPTVNNNEKKKAFPIPTREYLPILMRVTWSYVSTLFFENKILSDPGFELTRYDDWRANDACVSRVMNIPGVIVSIVTGILLRWKILIDKWINQFYRSLDWFSITELHPSENIIIIVVLLGSDLVPSVRLLRNAF